MTDRNCLLPGHKAELKQLVESSRAYPKPIRWSHVGAWKIGAPGKKFWLPTRMNGRWTGTSACVQGAGATMPSQSGQVAPTRRHDEAEPGCNVPSSRIDRRPEAREKRLPAFPASGTGRHPHSFHRICATPGVSTRLQNADVWL